jgi:protein polybromo-1
VSVFVNPLICLYPILYFLFLFNSSDTSNINQTSNLKDKLYFLYNYVNNYKDESSHRELSYAFKQLPSRLEYPDYYNVIKKPLDINKIHAKLTNQIYHSCEDLCLDFAQIFENACLYNEPGSQIYKDALKLQKVLYQKRAEIDPAHESLDQIALLSNYVQEIFENLFNAIINYVDADGRRVCDSFLEIFNTDMSDLNYKIPLTFDLISYKLGKRFYKCLDQYQTELFELFDYIRKK